MKISTPDLCDEHGEAVQVAAPVFQHYGAVRQFGGAIATVKCFEDNSKVGEMLKADGINPTSAVGNPGGVSSEGS